MGAVFTQESPGATHRARLSPSPTARARPNGAEHGAGEARRQLGRGHDRRRDDTVHPGRLDLAGAALVGLVDHERADERAEEAGDARRRCLPARARRGAGRPALSRRRRRRSARRPRPSPGAAATARPCPARRGSALWTRPGSKAPPRSTLPIRAPRGRRAPAVALSAPSKRTESTATVWRSFTKYSWKATSR